MIPAETIDLFLQESDCVFRFRKTKTDDIKCRTLLEEKFNWKGEKHKKAFQLNTNRPLADMGYIVNKFNHVWGWGQDCGKGGPGLWEGGGQGRVPSQQLWTHVTHDWPMASWVVVTWGHPPVNRQTDRTTWMKTLPSPQTTYASSK